MSLKSHGLSEIWQMLMLGEGRAGQHSSITRKQEMFLPRNDPISCIKSKLGTACQEWLLEFFPTELSAVAIESIFIFFRVMKPHYIYTSVCRHALSLWGLRVCTSCLYVLGRSNQSRCIYIPF